MEVFANPERPRCFCAPDGAGEPRGRRCGGQGVNPGVPPQMCGQSRLAHAPRPRSRAGLQLGRTRRPARAAAPAVPLPPGPCEIRGNALSLGDLVGTAPKSPRASRVRLIPNFLFIITSSCPLVPSPYGFAERVLLPAVSPAQVCDRDSPPRSV